MILVAGGTGFIGSHIVKALIADGHPVRVLSRAPATAPDLGQAETVAGDAVVDNGPLHKALGITPRDLKSGLKTYM